jgi:hypothetical protein
MGTGGLPHFRQAEAAKAARGKCRAAKPAERPPGV